MGLTQKLGTIPLAILTDSSNNVGIGAAANASFKLQVTGATNLTGVLTLGSTISNGTFTYTLPSATGTLALTSALSGYLPLTGGTLTGALSGTSATFTSGLINGTTDAFFDINRSASGNAGRVRFQTAGTDEFEIGLKGGVAGFHITKGDATELLTIASSGAATFSSSVTAGSLIINGGTTSSFVTAVESNSTFAFGSTNGRRVSYISYNTGDKPGLQFGYDVTDNTGIIAGATQATGAGLDFYTFNGSAWGNRMRITSGGNVGIGTSSPSRKLVVVGGNGNQLELDNTGQTYVQQFFKINGTEVGTFYASNTEFGMYTYGSQLISFSTNNTERMRITTTTPSNMTCVLVNKTTAGGSYPFQVAGIAGAIIASAAGVGDANYYSTSNTIGYHFYADRGTSGVFWVATNGDVRNANNSYGGTSDIKLKENITDATPKLNDLLKVKIRNYNFISDELKTKQLGVIAQELEEIFPNMVSEEKQMNSEETIKSVKYSIFVPMLIKAIQEQQAQIEELRQIVATK